MIFESMSLNPLSKLAKHRITSVLTQQTSRGLSSKRPLNFVYPADGAPFPYKQQHLPKLRSPSSHHNPVYLTQTRMVSVNAPKVVILRRVRDR